MVPLYLVHKHLQATGGQRVHRSSFIHQVCITDLRKPFWFLPLQLHDTSFNLLWGHKSLRYEINCHCKVGNIMPLFCLSSYRG